MFSNQMFLLAIMNSKQKCVILIFTLCIFCRHISAKGLCQLEEMFPTQGKEMTVDFSFGGSEGVSTVSPCPPNMVLGNCTSVATCESPLSENNCSLNTFAEAEGCVCPDGFLMKGEHCVPLSECGCFVSAENKLIKNNATYVKGNCTRRCICEDDVLYCEHEYRCSPNAECEVKNNIRQCYCKEGFVGDGKTCATIFSDCFDIFSAGLVESGIYTILPSNWPGVSQFEVYCNMDNGGGWTVFQRRLNGTVDFYRGWEDYKIGFGPLVHEFWLGNDKIASLTNQKSYELRIDLVNAAGDPYYAMYTLFCISIENDNYRLTNLGTFTGTAGYDAMDYHKNQAFSTYGRDNDLSESNCAESSHGAWWYASCQYSNLNGNFVSGGLDGIRWLGLPGDDSNIQYTEMKIRPT